MKEIEKDTEYGRNLRRQRVRQLQDERNDEIRRALLTGIRRDSGGGTTPTLAALGYGGHKVAPEHRKTLDEMGDHLEAAEDSENLSEAKRHVRAARRRHAKLTKAFAGEQ